MQGKKDYKIEIGLTIHLKSSLHIGTGVGFAGILDKTTIRDKKEREGFVYIPGSSIKGRLRDHYEKLSKVFSISSCYGQSTPCREMKIEDCCAICQIFGSPFHEGRFYFHDAGIDMDSLTPLSENDIKMFQTDKRSANMISRALRITRPKRLFTAEVCSPWLVFKGKINGIITLQNSKGVMPDEFALLMASIRFMDRLGGAKSRGIGVIETRIEEAKINGSLIQEKEISESIRNLQ